jgi:hypothetical protein
MHRTRQRKEMNRPTRARTRPYHPVADDLLCQPGDFEDIEDWMIGTSPHEAQGSPS